MSYDDWKLMTPEEDRERRERMYRPRRDPDDGPGEQECPSCGEIEFLDHDYTLCPACLKELLTAEDGPDDEDDEPAEEDATPLITGDDPDDYISDNPDCYREFGGES